MDEVTTQHPAGPTAVSQKMSALRAAVLEVDRVLEVSILSSFSYFITDVYHPQSSRFG